MIVVADTGPICYLILIEAIDILHPLYDSVLVPQTVSEELESDRAPEAVRARMKHPPIWFQSRPDPISDPPLSRKLDPGERAAFAQRHRPATGGFLHARRNLKKILKNRETR